MLLIDAKAAHERLQSAQAARENLDEAHALADLQKSLAGKAASMHDMVARAAMLRRREVPLSSYPNFDAMRKTIASLRKRFDEVQKSSTLTQGKHWTGLLAALDVAAATLDANQRHDWSAYVNARLFAGLPPERRKAGLVQTPENKLAFERYARLYERFARYRNAIPATAEALDEVHQLSDGLAQIVFQEDVPKDVEAFINALAYGASLELLTAGVIEWLRENDLLGSYVVRART